MHRLVLTQGERNGDASVIVALVSRQIIPSIDDFYRIPGDSDHMIFYIFALLSWSYLFVSLYYAYCAPERAQESTAIDGIPSVPWSGIRSHGGAPVEIPAVVRTGDHDGRVSRQWWRRGVVQRRLAGGFHPSLDDGARVRRSPCVDVHRKCFTAARRFHRRFTHFRSISARPSSSDAVAIRETRFRERLRRRFWSPACNLSGRVVMLDVVENQESRTEYEQYPGNK